MPWPATNADWTPTGVMDPPDDNQNPQPINVAGVVGNPTYPALFWYGGDPTFLMFRLRVSGQPGPNGEPWNFINQVWSIAFEIHGKDVPDSLGRVNIMDFCLSVDGKNDTDVSLQPALAWVPPAYGNPVPIYPGYVWPAIQWYSDPDRSVAPFSSDPNISRARWQLTGDGSNFNGDPDYFVDVAVERSIFNAFITNPYIPSPPRNNPNAGIGQPPGNYDQAFRISFSTSSDENNVNKDTPTNGVPWWDPFELPDYGDLPNGYLTLAASGGPSHNDATYEWLGAIADGEADGVPSTYATGDDNAGDDDEDGVFFDFINGRYVVTISVLNHLDTTRYQTDNPAMRLFLNGFIDANADGDFSDPGETLATVALDPLTWSSDTYIHYVPFTFPNVGVYSRWRLSYGTGGLGPGGSTLFGEVEDYFHTPEPTSLTLLALGGLALLRRRHRRQA